MNSAVPTRGSLPKRFYSALQVDGLFTSPEFSKTGTYPEHRFFRSPNKWGIELIYNGNKIEEYYSRFLPKENITSGNLYGLGSS